MNSLNPSNWPPPRPHHVVSVVGIVGLVLLALFGELPVNFAALAILAISGVIAFRR